MSGRIRLVVLAGGRSSEHEISLASAASVAAALDPSRYEVTTIEIGRDGHWALPSGTPRAQLRAGAVAETLPIPTETTSAALGGADVVLPILHGPFGEDGTVQGLCELAGVAYVGPGVLASSVCMDKDVFKTLMRGAGIPVARHVALRSGDPVANPFGYPVFVKPANMGSSVGISKVREEAELEAAVAAARRHDEKVMIEEFVDGIEVEVGVLGNLPTPVASLPGQVVSLHADWYDYSSKYDDGGSELVIPPPTLDDAQIERLHELALAAFVATSCEGMGRADFFVRASDGEVVMNELNTIPGFTATSFYARLFAASGVAYDELLDRLVTLALERHERRKGLVY